MSSFSWRSAASIHAVARRPIPSAGSEDACRRPLPPVGPRAVVALALLAGATVLGPSPSFGDNGSSTEARPALSAGTAESDSVTLHAALRLALASHPLIKSAAAGVESAEGAVTQAGLRPNPGFGLELENFSGDLPGARELETTVTVGTRLETGGKRNARLAAARADRSLAEADLRAARLDLVRDVRWDFAAALTAQAQLALAQETLDLARETASTARAKVEAGALPVVESTRARVAIFSAEIAYERAQREARLALERLALNWGGGSVPTRVSGELDSLPEVAPLETLLPRLSANPELTRRRDEIESRQARLRLERSLGRPDLELEGGYRYLAGEQVSTFLVGLSTDLPLRDRNQGAIREAEAAVRQGQFELDRARWTLERELRAQLARVAVAQAELRGLRRTVLPGAAEVFEGVREGYRQGRFTYLDVLEARRFLAEARESEIAVLSELAEGRIELERLAGMGEEMIDQAMTEGE